MSHYTKGRRAEYRAAAMLRDRGYFVVRSAGSRGLWDLVGIDAQTVRLIQVKSGCKPTTEEMREMAALATPANVRK
jgi:Holliday junction resolvase